MKRSIIDYRKLTPEMAGLLLEAYPQGFGDEDLISFKNVKGEWVEAVELQTSETLYLVKVSTRLDQLLSHIEEIETEQEAQVLSESAIPKFENEYDGSLEIEDISEDEGNY